MKKELFLTMLALLISFFTFKAFIHAESNDLSGDDYCEACCTGRTVSTDCCRECNYCQAYDDEAAAECRDYPA